ncbi:sporulation integral membrane protein YtvI [Metabacillus sp. RGM 3146]|uniref:sporulation integral membrane protein YtvI n=1 Tax=Metabacillus sp. RGM 3146 TaxID=3401092 RepID=UPI003B9C226E
MKQAYKMALRAAAVLAGLCTVIIAAAVTFPFLYPFYAAAFLAYFLNPSVNLLAGRFRLPRSLAAAFMLILLLLAAASALLYILAETASGIKYLASVFPFYLKHFLIYVNSFFTSHVVPFGDKLTELFNALEEGHKQTILSNLQSAGENMILQAGNWISRLLNALPLYLSYMPGLTSTFFITLMATFFISKDWYKLVGYLRKKIPQPLSARFHTVAEEMKKAFSGLIKAQFYLIILTIFMSYIGLLILRIPHSLTIALLIGLMDLIPFVGSGIIFLPWIAYLLLSGGSRLASGLGTLFLLVMITRQLMEPKLMSQSAGVAPLPALIAIFAGYRIFGIGGLFAGPLFIVLLNALYRAGVFQSVWLYISGKNPK